MRLNGDDPNLRASTLAGDEDPAPDLSGVPEDFHDFADVFDAAGAETLPPHRPYDLKINLEDGATPPLGPIYSLSELELSTLRDFIDENVRSGFIRPSRSPHGAPVLFVKKKDGSLRLCVDYHGLNKISRKDRYPLPLISDLLDAPRKARLYTKLDLRHAYYLVRIAKGDEWKTAFRTRWGSYEWLVMPFGLSNAPSAFQRFVNDIFADLLDVCVVVYLDDILIYSDNPEDHDRNTREVLRRLRANGLFLNGSKCEFNKTSVEYLGYVLTPEGLIMAEDKVRAILDWPAPRKVRDVQSFLGFANFYRRFIYNYSEIVVPLTRLTGKGEPWNFSAECQAAFDALKNAFTTAPVLSHYIPGRQLTVETDASDYAVAAILSVTDEDDQIRPIAFHSRTLTAPELNYDTHDKELLAIFEAFSRWKHYLEGSAHPVDVVTDHKNLEYFATTKLLTRRQVRWSEFLSPFNMVIRFRPGKLGAKPDLLTRRWDVYPKEGENDYGRVNPHNFRPVFTQEQLASSLRATYLEEVVLRAGMVIDIERLHSDIRSGLSADPAAAAAMESIRAATSKESAASDPPNSPAEDPGSQPPSRYSLDSSGLLRLDGRIYVPDTNDLRLRVVQYFHDHIIAGHQGMNRTLEIIRRDYTWPKIREFVRTYVKSCTTCARAKYPRRRPYGLLKPLPVPTRPWDSISMDFIEKLPDAHGHNAVLVIVDRLTKNGIFIPCDVNITAAQLAQLFVIHVFSKHGVPSHVTSDRGVEFVSHFFRSLGTLLQMTLHFTSGYHPEADGQTERVNQTLEQYIRIYCSYQQDNWDILLPLAEFAYNNAPNASTGVSPFFANKGYHPSISVHPERDVASREAITFAVDLQDLHNFLREEMTLAQERYKITADRLRLPDPGFKVGDKAFVKSKYIATTRPTRKFADLFLGPFEIIGKPSAQSYTLRLPQSMRLIHPVFHVSMLKEHTENTIPNRVIDPPPPIVVDEDSMPEYELSEILDSKVDRRRRCPILYLVKWTGYEGTDQESDWIPASELDNAQESLDEFHARYPQKPGPWKPS